MSPRPTAARLALLLGAFTALLSLGGIVLHLCMGGFSLWWLVQLGVCLLVGAASLLPAVRERLQKYLIWWDLLLILILFRSVYLLWMEIGLLLWLRRG